MNLNDYQNEQERILYDEGRIHKSHSMFLDLTDMWRGCTSCGVGNGSKNEKARLAEECKGPGNRIYDLIAKGEL